MNTLGIVKLKSESYFVQVSSSRFKRVTLGLNSNMENFSPKEECLKMYWQLRTFNESPDITRTAVGLTKYLL